MTHSFSLFHVSLYSLMLSSAPSFIIRFICFSNIFFFVLFFLYSSPWLHSIAPSLSLLSAHPDVAFHNSLTLLSPQLMIRISLALSLSLACWLTWLPFRTLLFVCSFSLLYRCFIAALSFLPHFAVSLLSQSFSLSSTLIFPLSPSFSLTLSLVHRNHPFSISRILSLLFFFK